MKSGPGILLVILVILVAACCCTGPGGGWNTTAPPPAADGSDVPVGKGTFVFFDIRGNANRPIQVYTYRPASWNASGQVLIVMHGAGRSAVPLRDLWIPYGDVHSCLIVAPEFSLKYYPNDYWYAGGNLHDGKGNPNPKENWTYMAIEHVFDDFRNRTGARQETYLLFGHSAGAQFVHRLATFLPEARYSRAVAANAGVYAMPTYSVAYPFGLLGSPLPESDIPKVFLRKLIIMSGADDTNPRDTELAGFPEAEAQGSNRFERAKNYYATAEREAKTRGIPLNWEYHVVPGVGHDEAGMARPAVELLFAPG
ncbi:MAG: hypothetical protein LUQ19_00380 [Methanoregula sp.]|nr:hypothetical protein [Methanoregula sp.]